MVGVVKVRLPKALCIALLLTLAATLVAGAGSAAAQRLTFCKANETLCKGANLAGEGFSAQAEATLSFAGSGTIECASIISQSEMDWINTLSFSECSEGCTVSANGLPYGGGSYTSVAGGSANWAIYGYSGPVALAVKCKTAECVYSNTVAKGAFYGGEPAYAYVSETLVEKEKSFFCPESMVWEGFYEVTSPASPLYITYRAIEGPAFCTSNLELCPQESIPTNFTNTLAKSGMIAGAFGGGGTITCAEGFFLIQDEESEPKGPWRYKPGSFGKCTSATYTGCSVHYAIGPYKVVLFPTGKGNGVLTAGKGFGKEEPTLEVSCTYLKKLQKCKYRTPEFKLEFQGGGVAFLEETAIFERIEGPEAFCSKEVVLLAEYSPFYVGGTSMYLTEAEA